MKISKYINKYDFIDYYTKQKAMWFFTNSEIQTGIDLILSQFGVSNDQIDDEDEEKKDNEEYDSYEYFSQLKLENENIDENNPIIIEGKKIDQLSKDEIKRMFSINNVIDFDDKEYKGINMEVLANKTKDLLTSSDQIIIFQPVFIFENLITKPDALIKEGSSIKIIETKCTTTSKLVHLLDLLFQKNVIEKQYFLNGCSFEYNLCLVSYNRMNKNEVGFIIAKNCNISKSSPNIPEKIKKSSEISDDEKIKYKQMLKIGESFNDEDDINGILITDILKNDWNTWSKKYDKISNSKSKNSMINFRKILSDVINNFDYVVDELIEHKKNMTTMDFPKNFRPSKNDKSFFKICSYWIQLRQIYAKMGYSLFLYSGYVADQTSEKIEEFKKGDDLKDYLKISKKNNFIEKYLNSKNEIILNESKTFNTFNKIKKNKVYFDFESINTAIRNVDNSLPFNQIVSQCSIIKWFENEKLDNLKCENLIVDPKKIDIAWFKKIIDHIYSGNDVSYVVYNKAFEDTRLKEMAEFINEKDYYQKVELIRLNIYDLADFFDPRKDLITIKELYGFFSIKKVLAIIEKYSSELFDMTKSKNYKSLKITNGVDCQQKTVLRFFDKIDDIEWEEISSQLKEYCENDVRAMIAVELYIKKIIQNKK